MWGSRPSSTASLVQGGRSWVMNRESRATGSRGLWSGAGRRFNFWIREEWFLTAPISFRQRPWSKYRSQSGRRTFCCWSWTDAPESPGWMSNFSRCCAKRAGRSGLWSTRWILRNSNRRPPPSLRSGSTRFWRFRPNMAAESASFWMRSRSRRSQSRRPSSPSRSRK